MIEYKVNVKTGDKWFAGTDNSVYINIIGDKGALQFTKLSNTFENNFEKGKTDQFKLSTLDLGRISTTWTKCLTDSIKAK